MNAQLPCSFRLQINEVGIELDQRALPPLKDNDLGHACTSSDVRKLECDIATTDEYDTRWNGFEFEKLCARREELFPGNTKRHGARTRCNVEVLRMEFPISYLHDLRCGKPGRTMHRYNANFLKALLQSLRHDVGEGSLESHHLGPVDGHLVAPDSLNPHAIRPVDCLGDTHEHFLGIATA